MNTSQVTGCLGLKESPYSTDVTDEGEQREARELAVHFGRSERRTQLVASSKGELLLLFSLSQLALSLSPAEDHGVLPEDHLTNGVRGSRAGCKGGGSVTIDTRSTTAKLRGRRSWQLCRLS